jgi:hypothetical protein
MAAGCLVFRRWRRGIPGERGRDNLMNRLLRILAVALTFVATFYFCFWMAFTLLLRASPTPWLRVPGSLALAALAGHFVWRRLDAPAAEPEPADIAGQAASLSRAVGLGALLTGAVGFVGGFFGPMLLSSDSPQGPMLGIFITGPLGVVLGAIGGVVYWVARKNAAPRPK